MTKSEELYQKALALNNSGEYIKAVNIWGDAADALYNELASAAGKSLEAYLTEPPESIYSDLAKNKLSAHIFTGKALSSMFVGDFGLASKLLQDAIKILSADDNFDEPFYYLTYLQYIAGFEKEAKETWHKGLAKNPHLFEKHRELFARIAGITAAGSKQAFERFLKSN